MLRNRLFNRAVFAPDNDGNTAVDYDNIDVGAGPSQDDDTESKLDRFMQEGDKVDDGSTQTDETKTSQGSGEGESQTTEGQQGTGEGTGGNQQDQQGTQEQQEQKRTAGPQDLTLNDGTVIRGGPERRLYEKTQKLENERQQLNNQLQQANQQLQQAQGQVKAYEQAFSGAKELGVSPQEANIGHRLIASYKSDPVGTVNYLLTELKAAGYDTSQIGGSTVDTNAIQRAIERQLQPVTERYRAEQQQSEQEKQVDQEVNNFFNRFPDAATHENEIAQIVERNPNMSLDAAYYAMREYFARNQLDWSRPLAQQTQGAQQQGGQQPQGQQQPQQQAQPSQSIPNGRGTSQAGAPVHEQYDPSKSNPESQDWDDIIRGAMRSAGINT
jgi:hypothetical protein